MAFPFLLYRQDFAISKAPADENHHLGHDIRLWAFHHHGSVLYAHLLASAYPFASQENRSERKHDKVFVTVRDNNVDQALRVLKKKMQREGLFREMKNRRSYEKPSERRARENAESTRRVRKLMRKRMEREGF
jgi:small subunit ribosomal protein S21